MEVDWVDFATELVKFTGILQWVLPIIGGGPGGATKMPSELPNVWEAVTDLMGGAQNWNFGVRYKGGDA